MITYTLDNRKTLEQELPLLECFDKKYPHPLYLLTQSTYKQFRTNQKKTNLFSTKKVETLKELWGYVNKSKSEFSQFPELNDFIDFDIWYEKNIKQENKGKHLHELYTVVKTTKIANALDETNMQQKSNLFSIMKDSKLYTEENILQLQSQTSRGKIYIELWKLNTKIFDNKVFQWESIMPDNIKCFYDAINKL